MRTFSRRTLLAATPLSLSSAPTAAVRLPRPVRVAIIGTVGHTAEILSPLPTLPDVEVVAIADPDASARAKLARNPRLASARQYDDYRELLQKEKLDIAAICNDNGARAAAITACARQRIHIVAEKPFATNLADFRSVRKAIQDNGIKASMLLPMRFWPVFVAMRNVVASGAIGEVAQIESQKSYRTADWPAWKSRRSTYGSTILWIGPHSVDLMRHIGGREMVDAVSYQAHIGMPQLGEMENSTATLFHLDNGGIAVMRLDYLRPDAAPTHEDDRLRIGGTKGVIEFQASTGLTLMTSTRSPEVLRELPTVPPLFTEFLEYVYLGKQPTLDLASIYRVNEIVLAADASARNPRIVRT